MPGGDLGGYTEVALPGQGKVMTMAYDRLSSPALPLAQVPIIWSGVAMATPISIDRAPALPRGRAMPPGPH